MKSETEHLKRSLEAAKRILDNLKSKKGSLTPDEEKCLDSLISSLNTTDFPFEIFEKSIKTRF